MKRLGLAVLLAVALVGAASGQKSFKEEIEKLSTMANEKPGDRAALAGEKTFTGEGEIPPTYFGITIHHADAGSPWPSFPVHAMRLWDVVFWRTLQTGPATYDWKKLDTYISLKESHGVADALFTFGATPTWLSTTPKEDKCSEGPGSCYPPANMEPFKAFITELTQRYCGKIRFYEVWNEADSKTFWAGTPEELVKLAAVEYPIVKSRENCACDRVGCGPRHAGENPNIMVAPSITHLGAAKWEKEFLEAGGDRYVDILNYHGYGYIPNPESYDTELIALREASRKRLPIWDTESSFMYIKDMPSVSNQVAWMARTYLTKWAMGVSRFYWYAFDNGNWGSMWHKEGGETDVARAYGNLEKWMIGATESCTVDKDKVWVCTFRRNNPEHYVGYAVWSAGAQTKFRVPPEVTQFRDLWGNTNPIAPGKEVPATMMPMLYETKRAW